VIDEGEINTGFVIEVLRFRVIGEDGSERMRLTVRLQRLRLRMHGLRVSHSEIERKW